MQNRRHSWGWIVAEVPALKFVLSKTCIAGWQCCWNLFLTVVLQRWFPQAPPSVDL